jgi:hypothetical protein
MSPGYVFGIYLDDVASYWTVKNNIVYGINLGGGNGGCPVFMKGKYQNFTNNILADNNEGGIDGHQVRIQATNDVENDHLTLSRNIYDQVDGKNVYLFSGNWLDDSDRVVESDYNLVYHPGGTYDVHNIPGDDTWAVWKTLWSNKYDQNSDIGDPLFVDRANHDYTVQPGSPALANGFVNIDQDSIGLKDDFPFGNDGGVE